MEIFSKRIKELRLLKGLYQSDVAEGTGFSQTAIARWEAGDRLASIEAVVKLAKFFEVSADYLLGLED